MIVKGRMGRSNESAAVSKERDLQIMILLYAKARGDHAAEDTIRVSVSRKGTEFFRALLTFDHEEGLSVNPLSYNTYCISCGRCPIGILRNSWEHCI